MEPSGNLAENFGLPRLVGPYLISAVALFLATLVIQIFLRPDPYLLAQKESAVTTAVKRSTKRHFHILRE